jgi:hypothetical protein
MTVVGRGECSALITVDVARSTAAQRKRSRDPFGDEANDFALGRGERCPAGPGPLAFTTTTLCVGDRVIGGHRGRSPDRQARGNECTAVARTPSDRMCGMSSCVSGAAVSEAGNVTDEDLVGAEGVSVGAV